MSMTLTCQFALLFTVYSQGNETIKAILSGFDKKTMVQKLVYLFCAVAYIVVILRIGRNLPVFL